MRFIPRYSPRVHGSAAFQGDARARVMEILHIPADARLAAVGAGRVALRLLFQALKDRDARRHVVMSAQICPIVPRIAIAAGFTPFFADTDMSVPSPGGPELQAAFSAAGGKGAVAAVIASPMYGCFGPDVAAMRNELGDTALVADAAQGLLPQGEGAALMAAADAAIFSFGLGKGADTGGGLLALRRLAMPELPAPQKLASAAPLAAALRVLEASGFYRFAAPFLDAQSARDCRPAAAEFSTTQWRDQAFDAWAVALSLLEKDVALARRRAAILFASPVIAAACRDAHIYGGAQTGHLRQILRLRDPARRAAVLADLRAAGIDALPAGEVLPDAYLVPGQYGACGGADPWQNARTFRADAIRLPFLARLGEPAFRHVLHCLEDSLG